MHLASWPTGGAADAELIAGMEKVRALASAGLQLREKAGIKVRQPLAMLEIVEELSHDLRALLAEELNVKEVITRTELKEPRLDTQLTPALREEGLLREVLRKVQDERKNRGLKVEDAAAFGVELTEEEAAVAKKNVAEIREATNVELDVR